MKQKILFLLSMFVMSLTAMGQTPVQPSGSGTKDDPYRIGTVEEFLYIVKRYSDGKYYELTNDIDLSPVCHPADEANGISEANWMDVEFYQYGFKGNLDGQGYAIKNLYIREKKGVAFYGLIPNLSSSSIKKLKLLDVDISIDYNGSDSWIEVGGFGAYSNGSNCENCSVSGTIILNNECGTSDNHPCALFGGIVGHSTNSSYTCCTNEATITSYNKYAGDDVGGIVGRTSGLVTRCTNKGNITAQTGASDRLPTAGGIIGNVIAESISMTDCLNEGMITGVQAGGLIGSVSITKTNKAIIKSCLNKGIIVGSVNKSYTSVGHIIGSMSSSGNYDNETWVVGPSARLLKDGAYLDNPTGEPYIYPTKAEMKSGAATFALQNSRDSLCWKQVLGTDNEPKINFDRDSWEGLVVADETIDCRGVHTKLSDSYKNATSYSQVYIPHQRVDDYCTVCGDVIAPEYVSGHYVIKSAGNLIWFRDKYNNSRIDLKSNNAELTANIDLSVWNEYTPEGWEGIGTSIPYSGTFNGNGFTIKNLYYNNSKDTGHNGGLFKTMLSATITDLKIIGNSTCSSSGLLAYSAAMCNISKCYVKGSLTCSAEAAGGLVANANETNFDYCASYVDVTGTSCVGGLIGKVGTASDGNALFYCASYGTLKGTSNVGGLIGSSNEDGITNSVCYAPHASGFDGCYYSADGTKVDQTQTQMNDGTTLTAMNDNNWFQDPADVAPVLGSIEGYKHYQVNCLGHEIIDPLLAYFTRDDSEVRYYGSEGHHYYVDGFCECTRTPDGYIHHYVNCQGEEILSDDAKYLTNNKEEAPRLYNGDGHYYVDGTCVCTRTPDGYIHHYVNCQGEEINEDFAKYFTNNKVEDPCLYKGDGHHYVNGFCEYCSLIEQDEDGYYLFSHASQFVWLRENIATVGTNFKIRQIADIDMSEFCHPADAAKGVAEVNWIPIVGSTELAYGIYDGQGHTISGLYCNAGSTISYASLFGVVGYHGAAPGGEKDWPSVVKNLTIEGNIISHRDAAIFAGNSFYATFENCTSRGSVTLDGSYTPEPYGGGIVGKSYTTLFNYCQNDADVESKAWLKSASVGGIAGHGGIFSYCVNTGRISAIGGSLGGITGSPDVKLPNGTAPDCSLYNCGNSGDVCGVSKSGYTSNPGALVGLVLSLLPKANNCWANCTVSNDKTDTGGSVVTANDFYVKGSSIKYKLSVTNSYYNSETGMTSTATSKTTAQFASGEVTYLLGRPWGQAIDKGTRENNPVLNSYKVFLTDGVYTNHVSIGKLAQEIDKLIDGHSTTTEVEEIIDSILER